MSKIKNLKFIIILFEFDVLVFVLLLFEFEPKVVLSSKELFVVLLEVFDVLLFEKSFVVKSSDKSKSTA